MKSIKKILFITPPAFTFKNNLDINPLPPMGPGYIAALLEKEGYDVSIIDSLAMGWKNHESINEDIIRVGLSFKEITEIIDRYKPDVLGISNLFSRQSRNAYKIAEIAKGLNPKLITIFGGAHPTVCYEDVLSTNFVDYIVLGEGDISFLKLIRYLEGKLQEADIDGIVYKKDGNNVVIPKKEWVNDLNSLPFPARHLMNMDLYFGLEASHGQRKSKRFTPIITSRGCPAKCTFCSANKVWGRKFRMRSVENVLSEMRHLKKEFGIQELLFEDDNTTLDVTRAKDLFGKMIDEKFNFAWDTPNGVAAFALDKETLKLMKDSGCYKVNFAIESGNQQHLSKNIRKPLNLKKVPPLVDYARKIGMDVGVFLVVGMPGETEEMIWDSFKFVASMGIYNPHVSVATPYPGTELFDLCTEKGYLKEGFSYSDLYIRSFSISTPELPSSKLKEILGVCQHWILKEDIKRNPLKYSRLFLSKIVKEPFKTSKKVVKFIKSLFD